MKNEIKAWISAIIVSINIAITISIVTTGINYANTWSEYHFLMASLTAGFSFMFGIASGLALFMYWVE